MVSTRSELVPVAPGTPLRPVALTGPSAARTTLLRDPLRPYVFFELDTGLIQTLPAGADPTDAGAWEQSGGSTAAGGFVSGDNAPSAGDGVDGDTYFARADGDFYSPKAAGAWPAAPAILRRRYATLPGEIGVLDNSYHPGHNRRYGISPDGDRDLGTGTNWETAFAGRLAAWWKSWTLPGAEGFAERGYYRTAMNIVGPQYNGAKCYFDKAEFAGVLHIFGDFSGAVLTARLEDMSLLGELWTWDRFGPVATKNLKLGEIHCGSSITANLAGTEGRGAHLYSWNQGMSGDLIRVYDTGNDPNMDAAIAADGATNNPSGFRFKRWIVDDTAVHGVYLTGPDQQVDEIIVNAFGRTEWLGSALDFMQDAPNLASCYELCGVWLNRTTGGAGSIKVNNVTGRANARYEMRVSETDIANIKPFEIGRLECPNVGVGGSTGTAATSTGRGVTIGDRNHMSASARVNVILGATDLGYADGVTLQTGYSSLNYENAFGLSAVTRTGPTTINNPGVNRGVYSAASTMLFDPFVNTYSHTGAGTSNARATALEINGFANMPSGLRYIYRGSSLATETGVLWKAKPGSSLGPLTGDATSGGTTTKVFLRIDGANNTTVGPVDSNAFRDGAGAIAINATSDLTLLLKRLATPTIAAGFPGVRFTGTCDNITLAGGAITGYDVGIAKGTATITRLSVYNTKALGGGAPNNTTSTNLLPSEYKIVGAAFAEPNVIQVAALADLPTAVSGAITLTAGRTYQFTQTVDLLGARLSVGANTVILGTSSENARIKSTGLSAATPLITGTGSIPIRNIALEATKVLALTAGTAADALDWAGVNIVNSSDVGTIAGYNNIVFATCAFLNSGGLAFGGTIGSVVATSTLFDAAPGTTVLSFPASLVITRRIRLTSCPFIVLPGETGINVDVAATIPNEGYIIENPNFAGGGTYTAGVTFSDNKAAWGSGIGVPASASVGNAYMEANATATTIAATSTFVKAAGATTMGAITQRFSHTANRLTYTGSATRSFAVESIVSLTSGNTNVVAVAIYKNGAIVPGGVSRVTTSGSGKSENVSTQAVVSLATDDYVEMWVANESAVQGITVSDLSLLIRPV